MVNRNLKAKGPTRDAGQTSTSRAKRTWWGLGTAALLATLYAYLPLSSSPHRRTGGVEGFTSGAAPGFNVMLITLDTTRADHLGCYGYTKPTSVNLDRLASKGVLFTQAIAQASVTPVSHASIMTGLNPYTHGLRVMHGVTENRLADSQVTPAEVLGQSGYHTAAFVRWDI